MRRFDIPAAPPVAGGRGDPLRLVDPRGLAVAWLDPQAGRCVGYAVRPADVTIGGWRAFLGGSGPDHLPEAPVGCALVVGWPWSGEGPPESPLRWQLIERDPTAVTCACRCVSPVGRRRVAELTLGAWLDEGILRLRLVVRAADAIDTLRPQFRLISPGQGAVVKRTAAPHPAGAALVLRRAETSLRLTATTEPPSHISWSTETDGAGVINSVSATPLGASTNVVSVPVLTLAVGPLE